MMILSSHLARCCHQLTRTTVKVLRIGCTRQQSLKIGRRCYQTSDQPEKTSGIWVVDLRSDTLTKPTPGMREAMASAVVGDDVFGEDPTVNELQKRCASLFGKEDALFVPSGTMGNLISVLTHCQGRGLEAMIGDLSHICLYEQGGIAQFAGVMPLQLHNHADGTMDLDEICSKIRPLTDTHQPHTRLICMENTHNSCGGKVLPLSYMEEVYDIAQDNNLSVHLDGARVLHAATTLKIPVSDILRYTDSVNMCFSKGLAAPVGSIIAGTQEFIAKALRMRKALGGGMRQAGILAAAALYSLDHIAPRLHLDHTHAQMLATGMMSADQTVVSIDMKDVHSNIVMVDIVSDSVTGQMLSERLKQVTEDEQRTLGSQVLVKSIPWGPKRVRFVMHNDISTQDLEKCVQKLEFVLKELSS